jgi:endonuclease YncB( thermonuclease family)
MFARSVEPYVILAENGEVFRLRGLALPQTSQSESAIMERVLTFQDKFMAGRAFVMEITGDTDAGGRPLAYAFQEDGHLANAHFLATGHAQVDPASVSEFTLARLKVMERMAKEARRGCWASESEVSPAR